MDKHTTKCRDQPNQRRNTNNCEKTRRVRKRWKCRSHSRGRHAPPLEGIYRCINQCIKTKRNKPSYTDTQEYRGNQSLIENNKSKPYIESNYCITYSDSRRNRAQAIATDRTKAQGTKGYNQRRQGKRRDKKKRYTQASCSN